MAETLITAFIKNKIASEEFDQDDELVGICAQIFITQKNCLIFQCALCDNNIYTSFSEVLNHISQTHDFSDLSRIEEVFVKVEPSITDNMVSFETSANDCENPEDLKRFETFETQLLPCDHDYFGQELFLQVNQNEETTKPKSFGITVTLEESKLKDKVQEDSKHSAFATQLPSNHDYFAPEQYLEVEQVGGLAKQETIDIIVMLDECKTNMEIQDPAKKKNVECFTCERTFSQISSRNIHARSHKVMKYKCTTCRRPFATRRSIESHEKTHKGSPSFKCDQCERTFTSVHYLNNHSKSHKECKCSQCGRIFKGSRALHGHLVVHSERKFKCEICGDTFKESVNLKKHMWRHWGLKKYSCSHCLKQFVTNTEKKLHERIHTGERPFICSQCGRSFVTSSSLCVHIKRHEKLQTHKCDICGKGFPEKGSLKRHLVSHTEERNQLCNVCDAKFKTRKTLRQHMKIHEDKREYICNICHKGFNQKPALSSHLKGVHKIESNTVATGAMSTEA